MTPLHDMVPADLLALYQVREWRHASVILAHDFPQEWADVLAVLRASG